MTRSSADELVVVDRDASYDRLAAKPNTAAARVV
jgi:hypothetical protein